MSYNDEWCYSTERNHFLSMNACRQFTTSLMSCKRTTWCTSSVLLWTFNFQYQHSRIMKDIQGNKDRLAQNIVLVVELSVEHQSET
jgi:hypothetical protein